MDVARLEAEIQAARDTHPEITISAGERTELMALAEDLPRAWDHTAASAETRKRILRAVLEEIIVNVEPAHLLPARQGCPGAPYVIRQDDLNRPSIQRVVAGGRAVPHDQRQQSLAYQ